MYVCPGSAWTIQVTGDNSMKIGDKSMSKATTARSLQLDSSYKSLLRDIKSRIKKARLKASLAANQEIILFYWELGRLIIDQQKQSSWGDKLIDALADDLQNSFPESKGFSRSNLHNMKRFAENYPSIEIVQALPGQLPWTHNVVLLERLKTNEERAWYANQVIENGWSYRVLIQEIQNKLYKRQGSKTLKTTNFHDRLPNPQSDLAQETIRDPYRFHFLTLGDDAHEKEVQKGLVSHVTQFLLALGQGFTFYASAYSLKVSNKTFQIDILMYHTRLHCYVVIELKRGDFHPKDAGQLNFYLSAVDKQLKTPEDNPTIGLILCEKKDRVIAEYALQDVNKPIGISVYELSKALPKKLKDQLPTIEEIETELNLSAKGKDE